MSENPMLIEALRLAALGYKVFPLRPRSKKPLPGSRGVKDASVDPETIGAWWHRHPDSNIGLACDGLVVVDLDPPAIAGDDAAMRDLKHSPAHSARTPRGGMHLFYREPAGVQVRNSASKIAHGVDIRAKGGYVVVAPSRVLDAEKCIDGAYAWTRRLECAPGDLSDLPAWIVAAIRDAGSGETIASPPVSLSPTRDGAHALTVARRYLAKCDQAVQGAGGHAALLWAARVLVRGCLLDDDAAFAMLRDEFNPRCDPPWSGAELERDFRHKISEARATAFNKPEGWLLRERRETRADLSGILGQPTRSARTAPWQPSPPAVAPDDHTMHAPAPGSAMMVRLSDIPRETVRWVWPNRIPAGKVTIITGDPGLGKSYIVLDIIARVTSGRSWPDRNGYAPLGDAIILTCEDGLGDTIRPRLDALEADCSRVHAVQGVHRGDGVVGQFTIRDIDTLRDAIVRSRDCRLVMIDALSGYMGDTDSHNNTEVREVLAGLETLAQETGVAIVCVTHRSKSGAAAGKAVHSVMGSLAFSAAPRAVWAVTTDPDDKSLRVFACIKMNIARPAGPWGFRVDDHGVHWEQEPHHLDSDAILSGPAVARLPSREDEAIQFLQTELHEGPLAATEVLRRAKAAGHSKSTIDRAKKQAGVTPSKSGPDGSWVWKIVNASPVGDLGDLGDLGPSRAGNRVVRA